MPSRTLAATMKPQLGASPISSGTGSATSPAEHEQPLAPDAVGERTGGEVGERLRQPERDDERRGSPRSR